MNGAKGEQGVPGRPGRPGLKGDEGEPGGPGQKGPKGPKGAFQTIKDVTPLFFSYKKRHSSKATQVYANKIVDFEDPVSPQMAGNKLKDGVFTADQAGIYYFVYHVSAQQNVCLSIRKTRSEVYRGCDFSQGVLLSSGSVVLKLNKGDTVDVQAYGKSSNIVGKDADSTFIGFLLFPS